MKNILVTGGAGYIGSHTVVEMLNMNMNVVIVDNLRNSKEEALRRIEKITGIKPTFYKVDLLDRSALASVFRAEKFDAVVHFAGLKAVGESTQIPLSYYQNNVTGTLNLCELMIKHSVRNLVFSSSATVYGDPHKTPIKESFPRSATNPYGRTKLMIEEILQDLYDSDNAWNISLLRYFNPIGAHPSGMIGEDPNDIPNNLVPFISQVAIGKLNKLAVFGADYPTHDGTGVRDYIHVVDLAKGHIKALQKLSENPGIQAFNLGTGRGYSVLDIVSTFERVNKVKIPYETAGRRPGDIAVCYADASKAEKELGWRAELPLEDMCADTWRWQLQNPNGYE